MQVSDQDGFSADSDRTILAPVVMRSRMDPLPQRDNAFVNSGPFGNPSPSQSLGTVSPPTRSGPQKIESKTLDPVLEKKIADDAVYEAAALAFRDNYALASALPVFDIIVRAQSNAPSDVGRLHTVLADEIREFEQALSRKGVPAVNRQVLVYALTATADDIILNAEWSRGSDWTSRTLVSSFFRETIGGERFFVLLQQMMDMQQSMIRELEFFFYCLQFGFKGKYRFAKDKYDEFARVRGELYMALVNIRGEPHHELSPSWQGVYTRRRLPLSYHSLSIALCLIGAVMLFIFLTLKFILSQQINAAVNNVAELSYVTAPTLEPVIPPPPSAAPVPQPPAMPLPRPAPPPAVTELVVTLNAIASMLEPYVANGSIAITISPTELVIRTLKEVFATGSDRMAPPYPVVIAAVGKALAQANGSIVIVGHTDSVPIKNPQFPNNESLSLARADTVSEVIGEYVKDKQRISATGMGDKEPIATNGTPEGRASNRRIEITLKN